MEHIVIEGTPRTDYGKKATRALRKAGNIPCNLYGGKENLSFYAPVTAFKDLIYTPDLKLAQIKVGEKTFTGFIKEKQFDPVSEALMHVDFQELVEGKAVKTELPLRLVGVAKGVAMGGKVEQVVRRVRVMAQPKDLANTLEVDVTELDMGGVIRMRDINAGGMKILHAGAIPVARMEIPRAAKEAAAAAAKDEKKK